MVNEEEEDPKKPEGEFFIEDDFSRHGLIVIATFLYGLVIKFLIVRYHMTLRTAITKTGIPFIAITILVIPILSIIGTNKKNKKEGFDKENSGESNKKN